jgi:hypothetical protein
LLNNLVRRKYQKNFAKFIGYASHTTCIRLDPPLDGGPARASRLTRTSSISRLFSSVVERQLLPPLTGHSDEEGGRNLSMLCGEREGRERSSTTELIHADGGIGILTSSAEVKL